VPAGWTGSSPFPAVLARDPVLSRLERPDPGRDPVLSRPEWPDPSRLAGIRPFPGQNGQNPASLAGKGQNGWPEVGGRRKMEVGGGEEIRREKKKTKKNLTWNAHLGVCI
jgi:hypothetical protein